VDQRKKRETICNFCLGNIKISEDWEQLWDIQYCRLEAIFQDVWLVYLVLSL